MTGALHAAVRLLERLCDLYGAIAERRYDEAIMSAALGCLELALADLTLVRARLRTLDPAAGGEPNDETYSETNFE